MEWQGMQVAPHGSLCRRHSMSFMLVPTSPEHINKQATQTLNAVHDLLLPVNNEIRQQGQGCLGSCPSQHSSPCHPLLSCSGCPTCTHDAKTLRQCHNSSSRFAIQDGMHFGGVEAHAQSVCALSVDLVYVHMPPGKSQHKPVFSVLQHLQTAIAISNTNSTCCGHQCVICLHITTQACKTITR